MYFKCKGIVLYKLLLAAAFITSSVAATEIYRWVDEKGQVHFSSTPPPKVAQDAETVNLKFNVGDQSGNSTSTSSTTSAGSDDEPDDVGKVLDPESQWRQTCKVAEENAKNEYDLGQEVTQQNFDGGYISREEVQRVRAELTKALRSVSVLDCVTGDQKRKQQYQCLSEYKGLTHCGFGKIV